MTTTTMNRSRTLVAFAIVTFCLSVMIACNSGGAQNNGSEAEAPATVNDVPAADSVVPEPVDAGETELTEQTLGDKPMTMELDPGMQVEDLGGFLLVCSSEVVHEARCFTIEPYSGKDVYSDWSKVSLKGGRSLYYELAEPALNADGNKEQELTAYLVVDADVYLVKCADVATTGDADPKWCFPYLSTIEFAEGV